MARHVLSIVIGQDGGDPEFVVADKSDEEGSNHGEEYLKAERYGINLCEFNLYFIW